MTAPPQLKVKAALAAAAFVVVGVLFAVDPAATHLFPPCPLHELTGLYCPGCGSTRALHCLVRGNLSGALAYNPLMVVSIPVLTFYVVYQSRIRRPWMSWAALVIVVAFGVARNLPWAPFTLLAPH